MKGQKKQSHFIKYFQNSISILQLFKKYIHKILLIFRQLFAAVGVQKSFISCLTFVCGGIAHQLHQKGFSININCIKSVLQFQGRSVVESSNKKSAYK